MADRLMAAYRRLIAINLQRLRLYYLSLELTQTLRRNSPGIYLEFTATPLSRSIESASFTLSFNRSIVPKFPSAKGNGQERRRGRQPFRNLTSFYFAQWGAILLPSQDSKMLKIPLL